MLYQASFALILLFVKYDNTQVWGANSKTAHTISYHKISSYQGTSSRFKNI